MKKNKMVASVLLVCIFTLPKLLYAQDQITIKSSLIPAQDTIWVFTPSTYHSTLKQFPVLYLLHGYSGNYRQWNDIINLQNYANDFGFIIVCPDGFYNSWYLNSPIEKHHQYASFFFKELMPAINKRYRVDTSEAFIDGLSMGGYGALHLFLQHPEKFISAGSTSGVVNLPGAGEHFGLPDLLGNLQNSRTRWEAFSIASDLNKISSMHKQIIFDCGWNGPFFKMNEALRHECDSLGINATFITRPGGHNSTYWKKSIPMHFFFFSRRLKEKVK